MPSPFPYAPDPGRRSVGRATRGRAVGAGLGLSGLLLIVAGSFLPWLTSGGVQRSSYAISGIARRLRFVDGGPVAVALSAWPALGTIAMVPVIAGILRWWRSAAVGTGAFSMLTGAVGGVALAVAGGHQAAGISLAVAGPVVTVAGAFTALAGAFLLFTSDSRTRRREARTSSNDGVTVQRTDGPFRRTSDSSAFVPPDRRSWRSTTPSISTPERSS